MFITQYTCFVNTALVLLVVYFVYYPTGVSHVMCHSGASVVITMITCSLLSTPSLIFSGVNNNNICSISLSDQNIFNHSALLFYNSVLPFWLPITIVSLPMLRMMRLMNPPVRDKEGLVSVSMVVVTSYIVFYTPHAALSFIRNVVDMGFFAVDEHSMWIFKVLHSLFLLISFFFHIFRPLACLLLDTKMDLSLMTTKSKYDE